MKTRALVFVAGSIGLWCGLIAKVGAAPTRAPDALTATLAAPAAALSAAEQEKKLANPEVEDGYLKLGFDRLAGFKFVPPAFDPAADPKATPPSGEEQIPATVKGWNGKKALVTGFMQPTKLEKGKCTEFILMANQMACCFGAVPNLNDWIIVRVAKGVPVIMDVPISFYGTLKVGATFDNGYLTGIYQLEAEKMAEIKG